MVSLERRLINDATEMADGNAKTSMFTGISPFATSRRVVERAIASEGTLLQASAGVDLSDEQKHAIHHVTGSSQLSCVIGVAGAGKSTILAAARQAWEKEGRRVIGAALAGKAAKGLETSSGIQSRTLASLEMSWENEHHQLQKGDVLVIDEAGMIGSRQMARFISEAKDKGAKLVLVGDTEQLQPINAGAPFRAIIERIDTACLNEVHRQKEDWQRRASQDFAQGQTQQALQAYEDRNAIGWSATTDDAISVLADDYMTDIALHGETASRLALAHRRVDVRAINDHIRQRRKEEHQLGEDRTFATAHGKRSFASTVGTHRQHSARRSRAKLLRNAGRTRNGRIT